MVPPNILLRLAACPDKPRSLISSFPQYARPLDCWAGEPYVGEIRFNTENLKCYKYTENGWEEIK